MTTWCVLVSLVSLAAFGLGSDTPVTLESDDAVEARAVPAPEAEPSAPEGDPTVLGASGFTYRGWGQVTLQADGVGYLRVCGARACGEDNSAEWGKTYAFALDTERATLVHADGEWFIDYDGAQLAARSSDSQRVEIVQLAADSPERSDGDDATTVVDITGELLIESDSASGFGHLEIAGQGQSGTFEMDFSIGGQSTGWLPVCCHVGCGLGDYCRKCCSLREYADCDCVDGEAVCRCVRRPWVDSQDAAVMVEVATAEAPWAVGGGTGFQESPGGGQTSKAPRRD